MAFAAVDYNKNTILVRLKDSGEVDFIYLQTICHASNRKNFRKLRS